MKTLHLLLAAALLCLTPAAWAKGGNKRYNPSEDDIPGNLKTQQNTEELANCMKKCQEPLMTCTEKCKENEACIQKCGQSLVQCVNASCAKAMPKEVVENPKEAN